MKPIETIYNGYRFRSRLEARWAVFFDACRIKYQYEPEGFELDDGTVGVHFLYLFAVLDVNVRRRVLLVVLHGKAIARRRTFAAEALHLGADDINAQRAKGGIVRDDFTIACHDDFGQ